MQQACQSLFPYALELQVMLTGGEAVKGKEREGLVANYFVRRVLLGVLEP